MICDLCGEPKAIGRHNENFPHTPTRVCPMCGGQVPATCQIGVGDLVHNCKKCGSFFKSGQWRWFGPIQQFLEKRDDQILVRSRHVQIGDTLRQSNSTVHSSVMIGGVEVGVWIDKDADIAAVWIGQGWKLSRS